MNDIIVAPPKTSGPKARKLRSWVHRIALFLAVFTPVFFAVSALGTRFGVWDWTFGFGKLAGGIGAKLIFATLLAGVLALLVSVFVKPRKGWWIVVLALVVPIVALAKGASVQRTAKALPLIHDITTDTQNPPVFSGIILKERAATTGVNTLDYIGKMEKMREKTLVSVLQVRDYPDIRPLILASSPDTVFGEALATARAMGWNIAHEDAEKGIIEATATTSWFGFKDDVSIRIQPSSGGGSVLDIRSVSRVGMSDLGANADRIRAFTAKMSED
ncbi:MAG: DUF1499 domain-containing protein [Maricaulaceae bacterium]